MATTVTLKPNAIDLSGSTSGTTTLQATAVAGSTTITLPAATDTLVGKATTDTLTNKTLTSPTLSAPVLGTPASGLMTNVTGLPLTTGVTGTLPIGNGGTGSATLAGASIATYTGTETLTNKTLTSPTITNQLATTIRETITVSATASTGTIQYDASTQAVLYYTTNATGNFTLNFRSSSTVSLNTLMTTGESLSLTFLSTQGTTAYYNSAVTVDGSSVTPKYQGGTAWTAGNASSIDSYTFVIIKTGSAAFTVLTSQTKFA